MEKISEKNDHVTNDFSYLNRAVDLEVSRYKNIGAYYRSKRWVYLAVAVLIIALAGLAISAAYKLLQTPVWSRFVQASDSESQVQEVQEIETVAQFQQADSSAAANEFISRTITAFNRSLIETGETVVTGKTYISGDLEYPAEQYCYLEHQTPSGNVNAENLAYVLGDEIVYETNDDFLRGIAEENCSFYRASLDTL